MAGMTMPPGRPVRIVRPGRVAAAAAAVLGGALAASVAAAPARAPADAISEARLVEAAINGLTGLVASFTQTVESAALPSPQVEKGTLYLLRPGRMRWEYSEPRGKLAIADGLRSYLFLPEERQVLVAPLGVPETESGVALLLAGSVALVEAFEIDWGPEPADGGARPLRLTPRAPRAQYDHLLIEPDGEHFIRAFVVVDPLGSTVTYRFGRLRRAETLPESLFRFSPPAGVRVQQIVP
jgi:outer membrane lipoprotein carrier protein